MEKQVTGRAEQQSPQSAPLRLSAAEVINGLSACLALVRPVGMGDDAATEWLAVAAAEVADMRPVAFYAGCAEARQECTHHGQIVPTILHGKTAKEWYAIGSSPMLPASARQVQSLSNNPEVTALIASAASSMRRN